MPSSTVPVRPPVPVQLSVRAPRRGKPPLHLADMDLSQRDAVMREIGQSPLRGKQVASHYFGRMETRADLMTDLPASAREQIVGALLPELITCARVQEADGGNTVKTLWHMFDGAKIESVLMRYPERTTLCISSQAGCGMACPFCATGKLGLTRNLSAGEMLEQVRAAALACQDGELPGGPTRLSNVVFMGMGEPLANYKPLMATLRGITSPGPAGFGISARHVTVSTCGLVPRIGQLAGEGLPIRLAVSLHAPDDERRDELVPINTRWKVEEVLDAAYDYYRTTGRRVSIEYALMRDINDQGWRADLLAKLLNRRGRDWAHVNPIPLNPVPGSPWTASRASVEEEFVRRLRQAGITTTIRDTRGSEIDGACGQLAAEEAEE